MALHPHKKIKRGRDAATLPELCAQAGWQHLWGERLAAAQIVVRLHKFEFVMLKLDHRIKNVLKRHLVELPRPSFKANIRYRFQTSRGAYKHSMKNLIKSKSWTRHVACMFTLFLTFDSSEFKKWIFRALSVICRICKSETEQCSKFKFCYAPGHKIFR